MAVSSYRDLASHIGHHVEVVEYAGGENVAVECVTCHTVLLDFNAVDDDLFKCQSCGGIVDVENSVKAEDGKLDCQVCASILRRR